MNKHIIVLVLISIAWASSIGEPESLTVTIYNHFAIVKDVRNAIFDVGQSHLCFTDVSANIQPQTVIFKPLNSPQFVQILEQSFEKNLVNTEQILEKYIGSPITVLVDFGQFTRKVSGILLGYKSGYILNCKHGINIFKDVIGFELPAIPNGFFAVPTLKWNVWSEQFLQTPLQLAYRTTGFKWKADYTLILNQEENRGDLNGWVTIENTSGKKYQDAQIKLIAGDVNTIPTNIYPGMEDDFIRKALPAVATVSQKAFSDFHLYTLPNLITLNDNSLKQVQLFEKIYNFPIKKYHQVRINAGGHSQLNLKVANKISFRNSENVGLGIAIPKGIVRVFKEDEADGSLQFIGEDLVDHTPKNEEISLTLGNAFDIVADKFSERRQSFNNEVGYRGFMNITVTNHKDIPVQVRIVFQNSYGNDLTIIWQENDVQLEKLTSNEYIWRKVLQPEEIWVAEWVETHRKNN